MGPPWWTGSHNELVLAIGADAGLVQKWSARVVQAAASFIERFAGICT